MPYAVKQDLIDRFTATELMQLTDRTGAIDTIDDVVLGKALADADSVIDMHLAVRHALPLASVPRVLRNIACDLARAYLYEDRITEHVQKRHDAAMKLLEQLRDGKVQIGLDDLNQPTPTTGGPQFTEPRRVFSADQLADYTGDA